MRDKNPFALYKNRDSLYISDRLSFTQEEILHPSQKVDNNTYKPFILKRIKIWSVAILLFIFLIILKLFYLQIINGERYLLIAQGNRMRIQEIPSNRGLIYDRNEKLLVQNTYNFILEVIPTDLPTHEETIRSLKHDMSGLLSKSILEIDDLLKGLNRTSYEPVIIQDKLNYEQAITTRILSTRYTGVKLDIGTKRRYFNGNHKSLSHILGYMGKINRQEMENYKEYSQIDYIGKSGIELFYEDILKGKDGREVIEADALGRKINILAHQDPISGDNVILSIDSEVQNKLEEIFYKYLSSYGKKRAAGLILDPRNGEIITLVSFPGYDNNIFSEGVSVNELQEILNNENKPLFNRVIQGMYPSGSTIKPIIAAAALEENIINQNTSFLSTGGIWVERWFFPDWKSGGHGYVNVITALANSVNTYFYIVGGGYKEFKGLGLDKISFYFKKVNIGEKLGIDIPNETSGLLPSKEWKQKAKHEPWYIGDTYHLSIGQGDLLVTPLQIASWTAVIANGGTLYRPYIVAKVLNHQNKMIREVKPIVIRKNIFEYENIKIVQRGLREVIISGSAKTLFDVPIKIAGKTGTAEWSNNKENHAWFTGYFPYDDPKFVITLLVEEGGEGSDITVAIAKEFIQWWSTHK